MISPVDVLSGEDLDCVGPIAFLIPSNMPLEFPVSAADWISAEIHPKVVSTDLTFHIRTTPGLPKCFQRARWWITLVVLQGIPLCFDERLKSRDVCIEPILAFVQNFGLCDETGYMDSGQLDDSFEKYKSWLIPQIKDSSSKSLSSSFSSFPSKFWCLSIILNN